MKLYIDDHKPALVSLCGGCTATLASGSAHAAAATSTVISNIDQVVHMLSGIAGLVGTTLGAAWYAYSLYRAWKHKK